MVIEKRLRRPGWLLRWAAAWTAAALCGVLGLDAASVDLLVLHTTDIHGSVGTPCTEERGDWVKLAASIRRLRAEHGAERTLLIDTGDTCQGSFVARQTQGEVILPMLEGLGYDAWVPGNHEFDFGVDRFLDLATREGLPTVCGNLRIVSAEKVHAFPPWRMFECGGARVALIGATASYMRHWFVPSGRSYSEVSTAVDLLETVLPEIMRQEPDVIVLAAHQGWQSRDPRGVNEIRDIARWFPEIDLILGGHTHRSIAGIAVGPETWYVQPAPHAKELAAVHLAVDTDAHRVVEITSELVPCGDADDPEAATWVRSMLEEAREASARVLCVLPEKVSARGTPGVSCDTSELICRALAEQTGAKAVLHGRLSRADLPAGPVTEAALYEFIPYENSIVVASVTRKELEVIVTEQLRNRSSYVYSGIWGVPCRIRVSTSAEAGAGKQTAPARAEIEPWENDHERIRLALNSYTAAGGGGRFPELLRILQTPDASRQLTGVSTREALRQYLKRHADEPVKARRWIRGTLSSFD